MPPFLTTAVICLSLATAVGETTSIENWLDQHGVRSAETQDSRLGTTLLDLAVRSDLRIEPLLADDLPDEVAGWLQDHPIGPSLRLAIAERLFYEHRYDACLAWSAELADEEVFSPELLHYLRAVALRLVVEYDAAREELKQLPVSESLRSELGPARQFVIERLRLDLGQEKSKKLSVISERMIDAERRLALGAAGEPTQAQQQRAIDALDQLIKDLEKQQKEQQASSSGGGPSSSPAEESRPSELKGPGEVDRKRLTAGDPWGALSPAERERLTQEIARDFPGRYRGLIEGYFETLADPDAISGDERSSEEGGRP